VYTLGEEWILLTEIRKPNDYLGRVLDGALKKESILNRT
jgi:hypothetical protein